MAGNVSSRGLTLTWVEPNDNNATIHGYLVMYMETDFMTGDQEGVVNISGPVEITDIADLLPGVDYTFTVIAYNGRGESAVSDPLAMRTQDEGTVSQRKWHTIRS